MTEQSSQSQAPQPELSAEAREQLLEIITATRNDATSRALGHATLSSLSQDEAWQEIFALIRSEVARAITAERRLWVAELFPGNVETTLGEECVSRGAAFAAAILHEGQILAIKEDVARATREQAEEIARLKMALSSEDIAYRDCLAELKALARAVESALAQVRNDEMIAATQTLSDALSEADVDTE